MYRRAGCAYAWIELPISDIESNRITQRLWANVFLLIDGWANQWSGAWVA